MRLIEFGLAGVCFSSVRALIVSATFTLATATNEGIFNKTKNKVDNNCRVSYWAIDDTWWTFAETLALIEMQAAVVDFLLY